MALTKLLHHGLTVNDTRLTELTITVEDDVQLLSTAANSSGAEGCVRTRSHQQRSGSGASGIRLKEISILVKIYKLLVYELSNCLEAAMAFGDEEDEGDTDGDVRTRKTTFNFKMLRLKCYRFIVVYRALME